MIALDLDRQTGAVVLINMSPAKHIRLIRNAVIERQHAFAELAIIPGP
jgi:hypothetical protein